MGNKPETLTQVLESLAGANARLLQLSTEIRADSPTAKGLIKELLGSVQTMREQVQTAMRRETGEEGEIGALRRELERVKMLLGVAELFHSTLDPDDIAAGILDSVLGWAGAERGVLLIQDPATGEHLVRVGRELSESIYQSGEVAIPRTVVGQVLRDGKPVYSTDVKGDPSLLAMASVRDLNIRSLACLPLSVNGDILGVIYFDYQAAGRRMGPEERKTLEAVCRQAAQALSNANRYQRAREWARQAGQAGVGRLIGTSPSMRRVFELINQVSLSPTTSVLIAGASGTGKELVAHAIHDLSSRAKEPFVAVNCAALPATLLESELFGHEKGAFTDAKTRRIGLIEQADGGTLFLDEIAEMSTSLQSKLLRVLEERTIRRVGGDNDIEVDVRVIAATNKETEKIVETDEFREDLYYRLNVFPIALPLLADRGDDVILIGNAFIAELNGRLGRRIDPIDPAGPIANAFRTYQWPGNVRELRNVLERAMILCRGRELGAEDFPAPIGSPRIETLARPVSSAMSAGQAGGETAELRTLKEVEEEYIDMVMTRAGGDKRQAAEILGIDLSTLYRKMERRKKKGE